MHKRFSNIYALLNGKTFNFAAQRDAPAALCYKQQPYSRRFFTFPKTIEGQPHGLDNASDAHLTGYNFAQTKNVCMYIKRNPLNIMHESILKIQGLKTTVYPL